MTKTERLIKFEIALDIVQSVYIDYCKDQNNTRPQCSNFCNFIITMIGFADTLRKEKMEEKRNGY